MKKHSCQHLSFVFLIIIILTGVRWYLVALICIFLMISDIDHFSHIPVVIWMSSFEKCLFRHWPIFQPSVFFLLLSCLCFLYILDINPLSDLWFANIFHRLFIHSVECFLSCADSFEFDAILLVCFCFCCLCFWGHIQKIVAQTKVKKHLPCFLLVVI